MDGQRQPASGFQIRTAPPGSVPATSIATASVRSCLTCAKAKAKCVRGAGLASCERCTRLQKECQMKEPVQKRRKPLKLSRTAQLEKLESKLEKLVHTISAREAHNQQYHYGSHGQLSPPESQAQSDRGPSSTETMVETACAYLDDHELSHPPAPQATHHWSLNGTSATGVVNSPTETDTGNAPLSLDEVEVLFTRYTRIMAPNMPFVVIPPDTDIIRFADEKPFLTRVIATVTLIHDLPRQQAMAKGLVKQIAMKLVINGEKTLEVLQGILIFVTWYHPHMFLGQQSSILLHLAMALVGDLQIDKAPGSCQKGKMMAATGQKNAPKLVTNDERRALLGVYYLSSMMSTSFKKIDAMRWSAWMTDSLNALAQSAEYESDAFLVPLVQIQRLMEEAQTSSTDAPAQMYAKILQGDLERIVLPLHSGRLRDLLLQQRAAARVMIWEQFLAEPIEGELSSTALRQRLDGMWNCAEAMRGYVDLYFAMPIPESLTLPFSVFGQFAYVFLNMLRISTLESEGWDIQMFRERLDFAALMETVSQRFEQVDGSVVDGLVASNDAFTKWASKTRWMKNFYEKQFLADKTQQPPESGQELATEGCPADAPTPDTEHTIGKVGLGAQQQTPPDDPFGTANMPEFLYFDDAFWNSFNPNELDFGLPEMQMG